MGYFDKAKRLSIIRANDGNNSGRRFIANLQIISVFFPLETPEVRKTRHFKCPTDKGGINDEDCPCMRGRLKSASDEQNQIWVQTTKRRKDIIAR